MNRDMFFRGKRIDNGEWVEGYFTIEKDNKNDLITCIRVHPDKNIPSEDKDWLVVAYEVDPDTVGQYTGKDDKHGAKLWEGDVVSYIPLSELWCEDKAPREVAYVGFDNGTYVLKDNDGIVMMWKDGCNDWNSIECMSGWGPDGMEKIGDIHTNPELLEASNDHKA